MEATDGIISRLATNSTAFSEPVIPGSILARGCVTSKSSTPRDNRRLPPVPLPQPTSPSGSDSDLSEVMEGDLLFELTSHRTNPPQTDGHPDGFDLTSGNEDGEDASSVRNEHPSGTAIGPGLVSGSVIGSAVCASSSRPAPRKATTLPVVFPKS